MTLYSSSGSEMTTSTITENSVEDATTEKSKEPTTDLCPICSCPSLISCRSCKKISYCSKSHQRIHWKVHKPECYPIIHQYDEILGSLLIATRNIKPGEIILREKLLVSGPKITCVIKSVEEKSILLCLGCLAIVKSDYLCPSCFWPVCGPTCTKYMEHHENECEIFASRKLKPFTHLLEATEDGESKWECYGLITVLRGVLLKEKEPLKWEKLLKLDTSKNSREKLEIKKLKGFTEFISFIKDCCQLALVSNEDIELVVRVMSSRVFEIYHDSEQDLLERKPFSYLYYTASQASQSCVPNTTWIIQPNNSEIHLRALVPIQFGRTITLSYVDVTHGIMDRQRKLGERKNTIVGSPTTTFLCCECARCNDPTELNTFYSAIKCPGHSSEGWLVPSLRSLLQKEDDGSQNQIQQPNTEWSCTKCLTKKDSDFYQKILFLTKKELSIMSSSSNISSDSPFDSIEKLEEICEKYSSVTLHPNHFQIYSIEMDILKHISNLLAKKTWGSCDQEFLKLVGRFIQICKKWLQVADVLWPGFTRQRGLLLYYNQQGMIVNMLIKISISMRQNYPIATNEQDSEESESLEKEFLKILSIRKEVLQIFCFETDKSMDRNIAQSMVHGCPEIKILKRYIDCLQAH